MYNWLFTFKKSVINLFDYIMKSPKTQGIMRSSCIPHWHWHGVCYKLGFNL